MIDIPNILKDYTLNYRQEIKFSSIIEDNGIYTATTNCTGYISPKRDIWINGDVKATVTSFVSDESFSFRFLDSVPNEITKINLDNFSFFHGTYNFTNNEYLDTNKLDRKYIVWLANNYKLDEKVQPDSGYDVNFTLFVLEIFRPDWKYMDHHNNVMYPLSRYAESYIQGLYNNPSLVRKKNSVSIETYADFGVLTKSGIVEKIIDDNLSGVRINASLRFENYIDKCVCK